MQDVELYDGKPIPYAIGHSNVDQPGYENATEGLVVRVVVQNKQIVRTSFVPRAPPLLECRVGRCVPQQLVRRHRVSKELSCIVSH